MRRCRTEKIMVHISAARSHDEQERRELKLVDACIADIVEALNYAGILTDGCCCGHGKEPGSILLQDGRELRVHFLEGYEHKKELHGEELIEAFSKLFDIEDGEWTDRELDEFLRDCGHDPDEVGKRMAQVAEEAYQREVGKLDVGDEV